jgi:meso-butanediol dehydrogenase / (S,S)-butanediol dehydrogenase / diacetyl reductase
MTNSSERFRGQSVLISGTGGGLGRAAAIRFAKEGAQVFGSDLNTAANQETLELVSAEGGALQIDTVDVGDADQAIDWVESCAKRSGGIHVLVNNASAARFAPMSAMSVEDWHFTLRNELDTVFLPTRAAWAHLTKQGGAILNIASVAGHRGSRASGNSAHAATKGAVLALTRQWALEGAAHGVRALSVSPGFIRTPGTDFVMERPGMEAALTQAIPAGRAGQPNDIVSFLVFAASDEASYMTGTDVLIDGGMTAC